MSVRDRLSHAWNAFLNQGPWTEDYSQNVSYGTRPDRSRLVFSNERSIISAIYTRLSIDVATLAVRHVRVDDEDRLAEHIRSSLDYCLTVQANVDQTGSAFRQDVVLTMLDVGTVAVVPVDTTLNPKLSGSYDIQTMRVGRIAKWMPDKVLVNIYNDRNGRREEVTLDKKFVAIAENPLYQIMNEPNSTLQRLIRKLNLLDSSDEAAASGKLDIIIQLPYVIKSEARRQQAEQRRKDIEFQLKGSQYGIAYTDGTEKVTQLNRSAENTLLAQIEYLVNMLYAQLGLTPEVMNGTADEKTMLNYYNRTVEPLARAVTEAMHSAFLTKTAHTQGQAIKFFRDPFKLVPINDIAEIADKFTRNEIVTSNEFRSFLGIRPSSDPKADELRNSNMPRPDAGFATPEGEPVAER